jgi:tetratricopeptide (TPR) repeat protein
MFSRLVFVLALPALVLSLFPGSAAAADPKQIYDQSTEALYNLDFSTAQRGYETLTREYPDNPDYWNALASSVWLKITYDQQKLNLESFSSRESFGTKESEDDVNPSDEKRLRDTVAVAIAKADAMLKKNPNDVRGLYAKGISLATLASFEGTVKRSYRSAHGKAKEAKALHQQVLKLDPAFDDARMSVGTYDYVIGVLPGVIRFFVGIVGIRSAGKDEGIRQLETAAARGKNASTDAKMVLVVVYNREQQYDKGLRLISELHAKYPRNFLFEMSKASIYGKMKKWDDSVRVYEQILAKVQAKKDGYERLRVDKVYYAIGETNVHRLQLDAAITAFTHVVHSKDATLNEKADAHLWMGKIYDSGNQREKALQQYDAILGLNCHPDIKAEATRYKRRAFKG